MGNLLSTDEELLRRRRGEGSKMGNVQAGEALAEEEEIENTLAYFS